MNTFQPMKNFITHLRGYVLIVVSIPFISGCFGVAAVGVGAGALMLSDRRASESYVTDEGIELRANNRLGENYGSNVHVNVTSYNRMVLLTGEVPSAEIKASVEKLISGVPNVKSISNELAIAGPSSLGGRSNDTYLTSKVKARFVDAKQFSAHHVKVVTEAGVVFLLGLVTQTEADAAADIARTTGGVQKVVRVFEIISPEEARAIDGQTKQSTPPTQH
ncbi:transporter [Rugosibacter aromaticivorans]|uniref:Transporter n=1 Tax=Rugosibacter aromaticivorans TaxID=1565605 RepID=A0A0C5JAM0_9PROT|nr:BON domain-containing protein [Rugosibacter aromaticivorans]AJP48754.1 transporter [Rugosibacter aromaticivorans]